MAYIIYNNDGSVLLSMADGSVNSIATSLDLIGKNINNYGEFFNNNLIKLLTNFASPAEIPPRSPQIGQIWYNKTDERLTVFNGTEFKPTDATIVSGSQPISSTEGDIWFDEINEQLKIKIGEEYKVVGPAVSATLGTFGITPPLTTAAIVKEYDTELPRNVGIMYSYGASIGFLTSASFIMSEDSSDTYLGESTATDIVSGFTVLTKIDVKGDLYIRGEIKTPVKNLTSYYNRSHIGSIITDEYTSTNETIINTLNLLYPVTATSFESEVRVLTNYNTFTEVRHFILESDGISLIWEPNEVYETTGTDYWAVFGDALINVVKL